MTAKLGYVLEDNFFFLIRKKSPNTRTFCNSINYVMAFDVILNENRDTFC